MPIYNAYLLQPTGFREKYFQRFLFLFLPKIQLPLYIYPCRSCFEQNSFYNTLKVLAFTAKLF